MSLDKLATLKIQSKKRKNVIIISLVGTLVFLLLWSVISTLLNVDNSNLYEKRELDKTNSLDIMQAPEYKENWAIAMENKYEKQNKKLLELFDMVKNQNKVVLSDLKGTLNEGSENLKVAINALKEDNNKKILELTESLEKESLSRKNEIEQLKINQKELKLDTDIKFKEQLISAELPMLDQNNDNNKLPSLDELMKMTDEKIEKHLEKAFSLISDKNIVKEISDKNDSKIVQYKKAKSLIEDSVIKNIEEEVKAPKIKQKEVSQKKKLVQIKVDTSFNKKIIQVQSEINENILSDEKEIEFEPYHISTGLMNAFMVTGAYAPAFQEGSMEPLPVMFETEGSVIMANHTSGNIERCFILGSAKGNMNSQTADIKLVSINCLIHDGEYRIEGSISGWVIGESGMPGINGEMLHKNGAWLARTFVSGFFETFAGALTGGSTNAIDLSGESDTDTTTGAAVSNNLLSAGSTGISNVFSKLGDYYLKMAEQIFPVIEVKGGRNVDLLLIGGEDLTVVKNNKIDLNEIEDIAYQKEKYKERTKDNSVSINAFQKASLKNGNSSESISSEISEKVEDAGDEFFSDIPASL